MPDKPIRRYLRAVWLPLGTLLAVVALFGVAGYRFGREGRIAFLVLVMPCYVWLGWVEYQCIKRLDEMRQRLEMEAMTLAFIAGAGLTMLLFFIDALKLAAVPFMAAPMALLVCYVLAHLWARLRYRYWSI